MTAIQSSGDESVPAPAEINHALVFIRPDDAWTVAQDIARRIVPGHDWGMAHATFIDMMRVFAGDYPGYSPIRTLYHNLPHTLSVFMCAVRLLHGLSLSGERMSEEDVTLVMMATLMHDIGYAQRRGEESGTGAQFTQGHVRRGVAFMRKYLADKNFPEAYADRLEPIMFSTDPSQPFPGLLFPDERTRMLGRIVGTADLTGQMADRAYLEKLLFLYLEFKEANFGNYSSVHDLLRRTQSFYEVTRKKLDGDLEGLYRHLALHFKEVTGDDRNHYLESIEKNMAYLSRVITQNETEYLTMLKRGGIVEKARSQVEDH